MSKVKSYGENCSISQEDQVRYPQLTIPNLTLAIQVGNLLIYKCWLLDPT